MRNPDQAQNSLKLQEEWLLARKIEDAKTLRSPCTCKKPHLFWDDSPTVPVAYQAEYCNDCKGRTGWERVKKTTGTFGWRQEQLPATREVRYRDDRETLLLTKSEYQDRIRCIKGEISEDAIKTKCKAIARQHDIETAKILIKRRFRQIPSIMKSDPNAQGQVLVSGMIHGRGGTTIHF